MSRRYDAIVIGIGGMGSATAYHLASRGRDVLGLEQYDIPHTMGSSHGSTRIIRKAQYDEPAYVPLVLQAYDLWRDLEERTGRDLLHITGGIHAGPPDSQIFKGSVQSCELHSLEHEVLSAREVNEQFPGYDLPADHRAVYQSDSGFIVPEQCIIGHVELAQENGAEIRAREPVDDITPLPDGGVSVTTRAGTYEADHLVITAGAWTQKFLPELEDVLEPVRQVLAWFQPHEPRNFSPEKFPVFVHATEGTHYYGTPQYDVPGFKLGKFDQQKEPTDPDRGDREPHLEDEKVLRAYANRCFPTAAGPTMQLTTCMFTNTPDQHFILDTLPDYPQITVGAGFSGKGFKFASVIGKILADLAIDGETESDLDLFSIERFD